VSGSRPRVAWLTNDLPPHSGGIQQFVASLLERTADGSTLVLGPAGPAGREAEAEAFDANGTWRTVRAAGRVLPTRATARWAAGVLREHRADVLVVGSLWPLGAVVSRLREEMDLPVLGITHGAEAGLARGPGRSVLRRIVRDVDLVTVISDHTAQVIGSALAGVRIERLSPGVDPARFAPGQDDESSVALREQWGVPQAATVVGCVARLVPRKGQDMLLEAWPDIRRRFTDTHLVIVGEGPSRERLERRAARLSGAHVVGPVSWAQLPAAYRALDVFAMPVRTRLGGLDVEGLGISFLEAQAAGIPVVAGLSGGAPETVRDARCGTVVDGRDRGAVVAAIEGWLADPAVRDVARIHGPASAAAWSWDKVAQRFMGHIEDVAGR
jgi:phosphatidylinositol alpha-1,6-mannosyltransferase